MYPYSDFEAFTVVVTTGKGQIQYFSHTTDMLYVNKIRTSLNLFKCMYSKDLQIKVMRQSAGSHAESKCSIVGDDA